jgi:uncharacterized membrane protein YciS (DUF1049 family)
MKFIKNILKSIKDFLVTLLLILVIIFMINNREIIEVKFYPLPIDKIQTRTFFLMLIFYLLGLFTAILIYSNRLIKSAIRNFKQKHQIKKLESQINEK